MWFLEAQVYKEPRSQVMILSGEKPEESVNFDQENLEYGFCHFWPSESFAAFVSLLDEFVRTSCKSKATKDSESQK